MKGLTSQVGALEKTAEAGIIKLKESEGRFNEMEAKLRGEVHPPMLAASADGG